MNSHLVRMSSPIGRLEIVANDDAITAITIERSGMLPRDDDAESPNDVARLAAEQLEEYFDGDRRSFDVPLDLSGTAFRRSVWTALIGVAWGEHTTYGELGAAVGKPSAGRAVGGAIGANPIPLLIGCHRVLGSDGRVTGYSGGEGIPTKLWLLQHEGITLAA